MDRRAFLATSGVGLLAGCLGGEQQDGPDEDGPSNRISDPDARAHPLRGISLSPRSYEEADFNEFFELVEQAGLDVRWAGSWTDLESEEGAPSVVCSLAEQYGYHPIIETGVYSVDDGELFRPLDEAGQTDFLDTLIAFASEWQPPFLGIGVEVNIHAEEQPEEFETFVSLYDEVYDAIKTVTVGTQVYPVFQLEWMRGLRGGIFGGENDAAQAQWDLLERFPKRDLVAFTSYPDLVFERLGRHT
ncbi:MAG: hypothetical protein U5K37_12570 [Natrialbaceae archaeon]|nr:hypothetical protein [Natrialbaceae archaeon]